MPKAGEAKMGFAKSPCDGEAGSRSFDTKSPCDGEASFDAKSPSVGEASFDRRRSRSVLPRRGAKGSRAISSQREVKRPRTSPPEDAEQQDG